MERIARIFKQLGHPDRLRILAALSEGELTVSELTQILDLSQPRVTQYIGSLETAGLIERLREGSWVFVRRRSDARGVAAVVDAALGGLSGDDALLLADRERLADVRRERAAAAERFFTDAANSRSQLSHDFLPQAPIERALLGAAGEGPFEAMVDLGTGSGRMLALFASRVERGTGIDSSPDMLRVARHTLDGHPHLSVQLGDASATALPGASCDLVTVHHVLHYLDDPAALLGEAARLLRPGGTVLVADFAEHDREAFRERFAHRRLGFSPGEVADVLQAAGFKRVSHERIGADGDAPDVLIWRASRDETFSAGTSRAAKLQRSAA